MDKYEKKQGSILKILPIFLGLTAVVVMSLMYICYEKDMDTREQASQIAREYLLGMEAEGYLTDTAADRLIDDLKGIGFTNISLAGSTMNNAGYGNEIILVIIAKVSLTEFEITDLFNIQQNKKNKDFRLIKKSTAKN